MKINLTTLGCPKNIVDSEVLLGGLQGADVEIVDDPLRAETIILNTCGFIQGAKEESIEAILQAVELKKQGTCKNVFVTGCLSQRYQTELTSEIPEVDGYYGNRDMIEILKKLLRRLDLKREILGERALTTPRHYAYLKISEGCENPCTFCSIPGIRGKFRSRDLESLIEEAHRLAATGVEELILVAQDTTIYGMDRYGEKKLVPLLDQLTEISEFKWIRLLYTYPAHFSEDIIEIIADKRRVLNYVDMPIQHISDRLLRKMGRKVSRRGIEAIIDKLRYGNPDITLRTSLIVGFPGETEADHQELADFLEDVRFDRVGLFSYSREEDTPAFGLPDQVPEYQTDEWWAELNDIQTQLSYELNQKCLGGVQQVVIDAYDSERNVYIGRTVRDCPEIDNSVIVKATPQSRLEIGGFHKIKITGFSEFDLQGVPLGQA
ncbi:MAG: 30S ribosomal protein S12 methylthiotransferase RimO [bacterium]